MRKILLLSFAGCLLFSPAKSTIKIPVDNTGQGWSVAANWGPSGVPVTGDTIYIPTSFTLSVKGNIYNSAKPRLVIYIYGTLDFDPSGKIDLADLSEIHVHTGGSIKTNGSSSEQILINNIIKYNGHIDGNINGPLFSSSTTGVSPNGFIPLYVLPVTLFQFSPELKNNDLTLSWTLKHDAALTNYELEGKRTTQDWKILQEYHLTDKNGEGHSNQYKETLLAPGRYDYRLKFKDANGYIQYSKTISVNFNQSKSSIKLFPNPAHSVLAINYGMLLQVGHISLANASGKIIYESSLTPGLATNINVSHLQKGIYTLSLNSGDERFSEIFIIR